MAFGRSSSAYFFSWTLPLGSIRLHELAPQFSRLRRVHFSPAEEEDRSDVVRLTSGKEHWGMVVDRS